MTMYERLLILREITKLDVFSLVRISIACRKAENARNEMELRDSKHHYSVDYREANELEYELRMKILRDNFREPFQIYQSIEHDGAQLEDFVEDYIERHAYILDKGKTI